MRRAYKYRLYPTEAQAIALEQALTAHRILYNQALAQRRDSWRKHRTSTTYNMQSAWFKALKAEVDLLRPLNFSSAQATLRRLDGAFKDFFRRVKAGKKKPGYPRFKGEGRWGSVTFPSVGDGIGLKGTRLRVQGVEKTIRVRKHRDFEGKVKTISVKEEAGHWYAILSCDLGEKEFVPNGKPAVGIDMGLESFLTTSEGEKVGNPRFLKKSLAELRRANRSLARKKKGSRKRGKARKALRKVHARIASRRRDFVHKASRNLVNKFGLVAVEKLKVSDMSRNRKHARGIMDAGWGMFLEATRHKAEEAGGEVVEVDPKGTSQECSGCGRKVPKDIRVRWHDCPHCGLSLDRDHNAARNILSRALARTGPANGVAVNLGLLHGDESGSLLPLGRSGSPRLQAGE